MQINVVHNAKRNLVLGAINRVIIMLCPFVERMILLNVLGSEYLGLGSLYASVISVLSLSELGFGSAMIYNMYKPAAEGNIEKMNALLNYYRRVYRAIGLVIVGIGLLLVPFLPHLIKGTPPVDIDLTKLYLVFLGNSALSYFLYAYMTSVIVVHQRDDVNSMVNSVVKIGLTATQVIVLLATRNYYLFALMMPVFTIVTNLLIGWRVHTLFPQYKPTGQISKDDRKQIKKLVAGTFIQQACGVTRNSLDSICISAFLGLNLTAIYNNYYVIIASVTSFVGLVTASFMGGVGNHVATRSVEENYQEMKKLDFVYLWFGGWCSICLLCLYQPFMELWMGKDMLLPFSAVLLLCGYFYLLKLGDVRSMYSAAKGMWWEQRYRAICETLLNLLLNILLGKCFGIHGIILATMISLFLCNYLWSVGITFRLYFSISRRKDYYLYQGRQSLLMIAIAGVTYSVCIHLPAKAALLQLIIRAVVCVVLPNALFYLVYRRTTIYAQAKRTVLKK